MNKMASYTRVWVGLLMLAAVALLAGCAQAAAADTVDEEKVPIVPQSREVVAEAVIEPARWAELRFDTAGEVAVVMVASGEKVVVGAPLARLDTSELALTLESARQDVVAQQAALDQLTGGASETLVARAAKENAEQIAQAEIALRVKELYLRKAQAEEAADVAAAQARVRQLNLQLAQAQAQDPGPDVTTAQVEMERAQIALDDTQNEYNKALDRPWEPQEVRDGWARQRKQVELDHQLAQARLDRALNAQRAHALGLESLAAQITEAEDGLARALAAQEAYALTLDTLSAEVEAARLALAALRAWENPYLDVASEGEVRQAAARLRQAEVAVALMELELEAAELRAPFAGTVVEVRGEAGDRVGTSKVVIVLATLDQLEVRTTDLIELVVARVAVGQAATVSVDALPDREFAGVVREVALRAGDYRGDVVYDVTVALSDAEGSEALRWGMTAVVEIGSP